ncbi:TraR/DksA family transcriptional regulator [Kushneria indalinina]|uniref:TraR/DksA family transcriptional regulator n=1 Tax=Kushneria indalinina DSM 14324 TaxID=1122140 RepID=A0A3D9DVV5_9GAMM|nr:TraR/DksA family transcriptional regulator [Kushneria indalinina]REC94910.1 TraR/DksA family transcriptional regulator [Kushneria indalinina DSM 14324]
MADSIDLANENSQRRLDAALASRTRIGGMPSLTHCDDCGDPIPEARRNAVPGVATCIDCQAFNEHKSKGVRR